jgi:SAM-dependent MidA family methyltransferase
MIGRQLEEMWELLGKPSVFHAVEFGAGTGLLCLDIMNYLRDKALLERLPM